MLLALVLALAGCGGERQNPEQRVQSLIDAMEAAVESGSLRQAADLVGPQYSDPWHANRSAAMRSLAGYLRRHSAIHLFTVTKSIELTPEQDKARAVVYVAMTGVPVESVETLVSFNADLYRFELDLVLDEDQWRVLHAKWRRADVSAL